MGLTLAEKILARKVGRDTLRPGEIIEVPVDVAMMDDILGPRVEIAANLKKYDFPIWDSEKVVVIADHYTPAANAAQADIVKFTRTWSQEHGIRHYFEGIGPCHQILAENGFCRPGELLVGTDSHTCTAGAFGCFGTGIGSTEMFGVLALGEIWLRVPESIRIHWNGGSLPKGVMAKDVSLRSIKDLGHAGATYRVMEYMGSAISALPMDERMCLSNMAVEAGAKTGLIAPDETTYSYLKQCGVELGEQALFSDPDAQFMQEMYYDSSVLVPQIACPHEVDHVQDVDAVAGTHIDQAYIGSCTGGRMTDLRGAAALLKGKTVHHGCRLLVSPASRTVYKQALREGILETLSEAGATILAPTCGACLGVHSGVIAAGENCISSTNRNFCGRMGSKEGNVYLASAVSAAAAAIEGRITDPRQYM